MLDLLKESGLQIAHVCLYLHTIKLRNERRPAKKPKSNVKQTKKIAFEVFESFIELLDLTIGVIPMHTCHPSRNA